MRKSLLPLSLLAGIALAVVVAWTINSTTAQQSPPPAQPPQNEPMTAANLPVTQVYLFSSGVGYFQREGTVENTTRVDLRFPATDVNDLLKSLVLQDVDKGKIHAVSYDSQEPIDRTLRSYALDLTYNPSFGQLLNQARGEKVEVILQASQGAQQGTVSGVIMGLESRMHGSPPQDADFVNLVCTDGVRSFPLSQIQKLRFLNAALDTEFRKALEVLASSRDGMKRTVSLVFEGEGKRKVKVGYVVENPMWKASYRLVLRDKKETTLQGWAIVENTTDDDWKDVRMTLISGRPISFQMNLYQPLYVPRPTVEPERFASLRPPSYNPAMVINPQQGFNLGVGGGNLGGGNLGGGFNFGVVGFIGGLNGLQGGQFGLQGSGFYNRYQMGNLGSQFGFQGGMATQQPVRNPEDPNLPAEQPSGKLTWEQLQERRRKQQEAKEDARRIGSSLAIDPSAIETAAIAEEMGEAFQYHIEEKTTLPRQKSAMLPIVNKPITATRVSLYNEAVHARFPLLGLRFKNTTGVTLSQGPVSIYEGGSYAGDARITDVQPDEERFVSYALDLGSEVKPGERTTRIELTGARLVGGIMWVTERLKVTRSYMVANRSKHDRTFIIEHPTSSNMKLIEPAKALERTRDHFRFPLEVAAGKTEVLKVVEEVTRTTSVSLGKTNVIELQALVNTEGTPPKVKEALQKVCDALTKSGNLTEEIEDCKTRIKALTEDQVRLRANIDRVPQNSEAYKRYLDKFDKQETEMEKLQDRLLEKTEAEKVNRRELAEMIRTLKAE